MDRMTSWFLRLTLVISLSGAALAQLPVVPTAVVLKSASFTPTQVTGLVMWQSITNGVTNNANVSPPANSDTVKGWADLSGNGNFLIKLGGTTVQPVYSSSGGSNNSPYITFTAASAQSLTNAMGGVTKSQPNTYFFVGSINTGDTHNGALMNGYADQNGQINIPSSAHNLFAGSSFQSLNTDSLSPKWGVYCYVFNGSSSIIETNGVSMPFTSGTTVGASGMKGITIGNYFNSSIGCSAQLVEFLWYNSAVSSSDRASIVSYLRSKYGI